MVTVTLSENVQKAYSLPYGDEQREWRNIGAWYKAHHVIDLCRANGLSPRKILDCGAGCGSLLKHLSDAGFGEELYAVELSDQSVGLIREAGIETLVEVKQFDGYAIPFDDQAFDLVILSHVLEHVEHERIILRELKRVAALQCIEIPLDYSPYVDKKVSHYLSYGHINVYTPTLLRFLLGTEGFEIIGDKADLYGDRVREFQKFVLSRTATDTAEARAELRQELQKAREEFESLGAIQKEAVAHNYTILCRGGDGGLKIMEEPEE